MWLWYQFPSTCTREQADRESSAMLERVFYPRITEILKSFTAVDMMARTYVGALNKLVHDPEWRLDRLPPLLFNDGRCWCMQ